MASKWTYEGYWNVVIGPDRSAATVVDEFGLVGDCADWLDESATIAWGEAAAGRDGAPMPEEWLTTFRKKALAELNRAAPPNVTDRDIMQLRADAADAGDTAQVRLCDYALGNLELIGGAPETDPDRARFLCAQAIAEARAQE